MGATLLNLWRDPAFRVGLAVRLALIALVVPWVQGTWFVPFMRHAFVHPSVDPWSAFLADGGDPMAFPYGPVMYLSFLPGTLAGGLLDWIMDGDRFAQAAFSLTILFADLMLLVLLGRIHGGTPRQLVLLYWLSPIVLYVCYWHGQTDIIPVTLLAASLLLLKRLKPRQAGVVLALAVAAKLSMVLAAPFLLIYLWRTKRLRTLFPDFASAFLLAAVLIQGPYLPSPGVQTMMLNSPEISKVYEMAVTLQSGLKIYVVPVIYLLMIYMAWRIGRMSFELLLSFLGVAFFVVLLLTPASVGWFMWLVPFLVGHQITTRFMGRALVNGFSVLLVGYKGSISKGVWMPLLGLDLTKAPVEAFPVLTPHILSLWLSAITATGLVLALYMIQAGIQRNHYYRLSRRPMAIGIAGDSGTGKDTLARAIAALFDRNSVVNVEGDNYHLWERDSPMWRAFTHLNPRANDLAAFARDVSALLNGQSIRSTQYDHTTGYISRNSFFNQNDVVIANGLHTLYPALLCQRYDVKVFLDMDEELRRFFKIRRDMRERGKSLPEIVESLNRRMPDTDTYIKPQAVTADIIFALQPINRHALSDFTFHSRVMMKLHLVLRGSLYHEHLTRVLIGVCGLRVDVNPSQKNGTIEISIEGEDITPDDIELAAYKLIPNLGDLIAIHPRWEGGMTGVMQLVTMLHVSQALMSKAVQ